MAYSKNWKKPAYNNSEQEEKREIAAWADLHGAIVRYIQKLGPVRGRVYKSRFMPNGMCDIHITWGCWSIWVEVKRPASSQKSVLGAKKQAKGRLSDDQKREYQFIRRKKGIVLIAYGLQDVVPALKALPKLEIPPEVIAIMDRQASAAGVRLVQSPVNSPTLAEDPRQTRLEDFIEPKDQGPEGV